MNNPAGPPPEYSILIVGFRTLRLIGECLDSLLKSGGPVYEVLFLDNDSPEPEADWIENNVRDPRLQIFRSPSNLFFAGGVNYLAQRARGRFLVLLNPDTRVDADWLRVLDESLRQSGFEAAQVDLRSAKHPERRESQGYSLDRLGFTVHIPEGKVPASGRIFGGRGAGLVIRRDVFFETGAMDETFRMYFEETDLCWRINLFGYRIGYVPGSLVYHLVGGSSRRTFFPWNHFRFIRNRILSLFKNYGPVSLAFFFPLHVMLCAASAIGHLLRGKMGKTLAEGAGVFSACFLLAAALPKRRAVQMKRKVTDGELIAQGLILRKLKYLGGSHALRNSNSISVKPPT